MPNQKPLLLIGPQFMDIVKIDLLRTNNNKGFWEKENEGESCALPSFSHNLSSICLPYVCLVSCVVLAGTVVSVCIFDIL